MPEKTDWEIPAEARPRPQDYSFDLDHALSSVLRLEATVPQDAFSAGTLGTERAGNAVLIRESGTEPLVRVMAEGEDSAVVAEVVDSLCEMIVEAAGMREAVV